MKSLQANTSVKILFLGIYKYDILSNTAIHKHKQLLITDCLLSLVGHMNFQSSKVGRGMEKVENP